MAKISDEIKRIVEENPLAVATVMPDGRPNAIGVAYVKVVNENQILITDNFMNQTIKDLTQNPNVVLLSWDKNMNGYKFVGTAQYFNSGKWLTTVKQMPENNGLPAKGAVLVTVNLIIKSA
jgi:predicted pyridoxine 5'-phosphate oxidase superfamily flavin-nucleotide-binding protein